MKTKDPEKVYKKARAVAPKTYKGERLAKVLARAGLCSRRDAEKWIEAGRVSVDGKKITTPALNVENHQTITVDGKKLKQAEETRVWRYHKPAGLITTAKDPQGRPTVFDYLPDGMPRVISVGRLDLNSEGLLLLTNDGALARYLEKPDKENEDGGWARCYRVRIHLGDKTLSEEKLKKLEKGITVEGIHYGPIKAKLDHAPAQAQARPGVDEAMQGRLGAAQRHRINKNDQGVRANKNIWITMELREGKNREIRKIMEHLGFAVNRLLRTSFGPFQLGRLQKGEVEEIPPRVLRELLAEYFGK